MSDLYSSIKQIEIEEEETRKDTASIGKKRTSVSSINIEEFYLMKKCEENDLFTCNIENCGKAYTQRYRLLIHQRTHTGEKPYKCKDCEKCFTEKGNLKVHERIHSGERPYKCDFPCCDKAFKAYGQLKDHKKMHSDVRDFRCELCPAKFNRKSTLKMHMLIHTNEKPYTCPYENCGKTFREKSNMNKHLKIHLKRLENMNKVKIFCQNVTEFVRAPRPLKYDTKSLEISNISETIMNHSDSDYSEVVNNPVNPIPYPNFSLGNCSYNNFYLGSLISNQPLGFLQENRLKNSILNDQCFNYEYNFLQDFNVYGKDI